LPHVLDELVFADQATLVGYKVLEDFIGLGTEVNRLAASQQTTASEIERKVLKKTDLLGVHTLVKGVY
jgi:hypothetical protein